MYNVRINPNIQANNVGIFKNAKKTKKVITHDPNVNPIKPMYNPNNANIYTLDKYHPFVPPTVFAPAEKPKLKIKAAAGSPGGPNNNDKNYKKFLNK